jgi:endonuclease YncB( thermonuclease family)
LQNKAKTKARWLPWRNLLIGLLAVSLYQYVTEGRLSWPVQLYDKVSEVLQDYIDRPSASWREATDKLEELGAAREGAPIPEFGLRGKVVRVADGDTLSLLDSSNRQHKIRLHGIDTPEREQAHGKAAWDALAKLVDGRRVGVVVLGEDSYGRTDGTVYLGETNINLAMVAAGHAWWYRYYAPDNHLLEDAERQARKAKLGLWARPDPMPPWDWRRQQRYSRP